MRALTSLQSSGAPPLTTPEVVVSVVASTAREKVALTVAERAMPVAPPAGNVDDTVSGGGGALVRLEGEPARVLSGIIQRWKDRALTPDKVSGDDAGEFANGRAADIYNTMLADKDCSVVLVIDELDLAIRPGGGFILGQLRN